MAVPAFALDRYLSTTLASVSGAQVCMPIAQGEATAVINITGAWAGVGTFMVASRSPTSAASTAVPVAGWATNISAQTQVQTFSGNGLFAVPISGFSDVCVQFTNATSGTMGVSIDLSMASFASAITTTNANPTTRGGSNATVAIAPPIPNPVMPRCNNVRQNFCR